MTKITIDCISFTAFWNFGGPWGRQCCVFWINVEFIGGIIVVEFGVRKLTRIHFYGKFNVFV